LFRQRRLGFKPFEKGKGGKALSRLASEVHRLGFDSELSRLTKGKDLVK
jgi:hypothetical protein